MWSTLQLTRENRGVIAGKNVENERCLLSSLFCFQQLEKNFDTFIQKRKKCMNICSKQKYTRLTKSLGTLVVLVARQYSAAHSLGNTGRHCICYRVNLHYPCPKAAHLNEVACAWA
jgi:hypothetical protein